jgi:hypothetical protein
MPASLPSRTLRHRAVAYSLDLAETYRLPPGDVAWAVIAFGLGAEAIPCQQHRMVFPFGPVTPPEPELWPSVIELLRSEGHGR